MSIKKLLAASVVFLLAVNRVFAFGLTVNPGEFVLENLKIGQSYDISKISKPFLINYLGTEKCDMVIELYPPKEPISGYEPIPDPKWVKLDKDFYSALPGEVIQVTAVLSIPDDPQYLGKKYDIRMRVSAKPKIAEGLTGLAPAVESRIMFSIFKERGTEKEQAKFNEMLEKTRNISFTPVEMTLEYFPVGKEVDVKKEYNQSLKLTNLNEDAMKIRLQCLTAKEIGLKVADYESIESTDVVKLSRNRVKVKANQIEEVKMFIKIPDKPENYNKQILAICEAAVETDVIKTQYRARIFIKTRAR